MRRTLSIIALGWMLTASSMAQDQGNFTIHSITSDRQPSGDSGYTLDGSAMTGSRAKLLNDQNFGIDGTYEKAVFIVDGYGQSGDLETITNTDNVDLFYFGIFSSSNTSLNQFTNAELDSLYEWSQRGGKLIIGAGSANGSFTPDILNEKWGFDLALSAPTSITPTADGEQSQLFDGPFGIVTQANQGGSSQGFFDFLPEDVVVLAEDNGDPTVFLDCSTLDLVIADGDAYTSLGGISSGDNIVSQNDIFWANTIAYMDNLEGPPSIAVDGNLLSVGDYLSYQWFLDGEIIDEATSNGIDASENGTYTVEVEMECGCTNTASQLFMSLSTAEVDYSSQLQLFPNPVQGELNILLENGDFSLVEIYDATGRKVMSQSLNFQSAVQTRVDVASFSQGIHVIFVFNQDGQIARQQFVKL
ncbi:MAG: hypothetical protein ACJAQ4_001450 [Cryomorphaceae bacterium]|jgi:hypothetical protein